MKFTEHTDGSISLLRVSSAVRASVGGLMQRAKLQAFMRPLQKPDHRPQSVVTWLAEVFVEEKQQLVALKDLPRSRMMAEFVAAGIASLLGIRSPKAFIVEVSLQQRDVGGLKHGISAPTASGSTIFFASEYLALQTFDRGPAETQYGRMVAMSRSPSFARLTLFDLIIANVDRAERNILVSDGNLIPFDHDQSLFGLRWTVETLRESMAKPNSTMFDTYLHWTDPAARDYMVETAKRWMDSVGGKINGMVASFPREIGIKDDEKDAVVEFIEHRIANLVNFVEQRLSAYPFQG